MTFTLTQIFTILFFHFLFDFVFQSDKQAKGKSSNWRDLLSHTFTYSICWTPVIVVLTNIHTQSLERPTYLLIGLQFSIITFFWHTITDYITSRENKKLWEVGRVHDFFVGIGHDQLWHYIQLFLTFQYVLQ